MPGVVRTRVGYAGGLKRNPTYHDLGDHTETVQIDFDPTAIGYRQLLDVFWGSHNPCGRAYSRQYMSIVFYHDDEQKKAAEDTRRRQEAARGKIHTEIRPYDTFTYAEDYHQKYYLQNSPSMEAFRALAPSEFVASTAAARMNGVAGGHGSAEDQQKLIKR